MTSRTSNDPIDDLQEQINKLRKQLADVANRRQVVLPIWDAATIPTTFPAGVEGQTVVGTNNIPYVWKSGAWTSVGGGTLEWEDVGTGAVAQPCARVYHTAAQSIANATIVPLLFNSERFDNDNIHSTTTNTSRLTCKTAGKYLISMNVEFDANVTGLRYVIIMLNGTTRIGADSDSANNIAGGLHEKNAISLYNLAVNDYVEATVFQTSGGALNINAAAAYTPEFWMVRVSA